MEPGRGKLDPIQLERTVRDVIRQLGLTTSVAGEQRVELGFQKEKEADEPSSILRINSPVAAMDEVEGLLEGVTEVKIGIKTILTPSLRDLLRERRIKITRQTTKNSACQQAPLLVGNNIRHREISGKYRNQLERSGVVCQEMAGGTLPKILQTFADLCQQQARLGLLLTDETAAALCLANRLAGVRAIEGADEKRMQSNVFAVGANLLVISPHGHSPYLVGRLVSRFYRLGVQSCPPEYQAWLL